MPEFKTIRQTAATGILSEHRLRIIGHFLFRSYRVSALAEMLESMSRKQRGGDAV